MIKRGWSFWFLSFIFISILRAEEDSSMIVNSGEAQYNGKEIVLVGEVVVQHHLDQIFARRLSVHSLNEKSKFGLLKISDDVKISLKEGGELYCQQAEVDYAKMRGIFLGHAHQPDVTYLNVEEGQEKDRKPRPPLELKSSQMVLELIREVTSSAHKTLVKQIEASQNVRVRYNQDYLLLADHALYQRISDGKSPIAGLLTLSVGENLGLCKMTNLNGDHFSAHQIQVNTIERKLWLSQPKGTLYIQRGTQSAQTLEFSAHELIWDDQQQTLLLKGNVNCTQNETLRIYTDHELIISQAMIDGKRTLRFLQAPQNTQITYFDIQKGNTHKIYCPGSFMIDHERHEMSLEKPFDLRKEDDNSQVYVEDLMGEMYANRIHIHYEWKDQRFTPGKMMLEGQVRLINRFDGHREESGSVLHYALADCVEYFPERQEMVLTGVNDNRVLLFDKVNNVKMSAPSLKVWHDPKEKKEAIQGSGNVRFTFIEKEFEQWKSHFPDLFWKESKDAKSTK